MQLLLSLGLAHGSEAALLLCDAPDACEADRSYVESIDGAGGRALSTLDSLLVQDSGGWADGNDQDDRLAAALLSAETAARLGEWRGVASATDEAEDALRRWPGTVPEGDLFRLYILEGAALLHRGEAEAAYLPLERAAAAVDGHPPPLPVEDEALSAAWSSAFRLAAVGGRGTLVLADLPEGTHVFVDGRRVPEGSTRLPLLPGVHRLTALRPDGLRTWMAELPVLAERESRVYIELGALPTKTGAWSGLLGAFDLHEAEDAVVDLLIDWCARRGVDSLRLLRVEPRFSTAPPPAIDIGAAPETRPKAAEGELLDQGDHLPSTVETALLADHEAANEAPPPPVGRRLRVLYFDPESRRFTEEALSRPLTALPPSDRLYAGLSVGYTGMMERRHGAFDLVLGGPVGPIDLEGKLGLVRADLAYNLYQEWTDRQLYHLSLGARWSWMEQSIRPVVGGGLDVYVPVTVGAFLSAGGEARFGSWLATAELRGGLLGEGPMAGAGIGLQRRY